jgi:hypothetical protein
MPPGGGKHRRGCCREQGRGQLLAPAHRRPEYAGFHAPRRRGNACRARLRPRRMPCAAGRRARFRPARDRVGRGPRLRPRADRRPLMIRRADRVECAERDPAQNCRGMSPHTTQATRADKLGVHAALGVIALRGEAVEARCLGFRAAEELGRLRQLLLHHRGVGFNLVMFHRDARQAGRADGGASSHDPNASPPTPCRWIADPEIPGC